MIFVEVKSKLEKINYQRAVMTALPQQTDNERAKSKYKQAQWANLTPKRNWTFDRTDLETLYQEIR